MLPYISYCLEIWGNTYKSNVNPLYIIQKKAIRIICNVDSRTHTLELFYKLGILKLFDLLELKICTLRYKAKYSMLPKHLQVLFKFGSEQKYNMRKVTKCKINFARTNIKAMNISIKGVKLWNSLGDDLINSVSVKFFVNKFKKKVLEKYNIGM